MNARLAALALICGLAAASVWAGDRGGAKGQRLEILGLLTEVPAAWRREQPASAMRLAQFQLPGDPPAMLVVYFFGPGQGGSVERNIARWTSQFSRPDGAAVTPRVRVLRGTAARTTLVDLEGSYRRGVGAAPTAQPLPGQTLLAAVVEAPGGTVFVQLWGASTTVRAHQPAFEASLQALSPTRTH